MFLVKCKRTLVALPVRPTPSACTMGGMTVKCSPRLGALILLASALLATGCEGQRPVALLTFWDASASSQIYQQQCEKLLRQETRRLFPQDSLGLYRVSQEVACVYSGPALGNSLKTTLETYFLVRPEERGTAMGTALEMATRDSLEAQRQGYRPVLLFLGDLADERVEGGGNIDWTTLPLLAQQLPPDSQLVCVYSEPRFADRLRQTLHPVLKERLVLINPELAASPGGVRLLRKAIGR